MKITSNQNLVEAIENQDGIADRNLPIYLSDYTVRVTSSHVLKTSILWSTVSFLPATVEMKRILNVQLAVSILSPLTPSLNTLEDLSFIFDFSFFAEFLRTRFFITIEGPLEGSIAFEGNNESFNAFRYVDYTYRELTNELTLRLKNLDFVSEIFPMTVYLNIRIRDDVDNPEGYPTLFPSLVSENILRMPQEVNDGEGVRVVLILLCCCPEDLKTLQISEVNLNSPQAFNPTIEVEYLLARQGIVPPIDGVRFRFQAAADFPIMGDDVEALPWKESTLMEHMNFELQVLFSNAVFSSAIILYDYNVNPLGPAYMTWLKNNTQAYDIVATSQMNAIRPPWDDEAFQDTDEFYEDVLSFLHTQRKPVITCSYNEGTDVHIYFPSPQYNFIIANSQAITSAGFILCAEANFDIDGPYQNSYYSSGGYCNITPRPPEQFDVVYDTNYGSPDLGGYYGPYWFCLDYGYLTKRYGSSWTPQPLAALFAKIYVNTQRRDWDFKYILYKKGLTLCTYIVKGNNLGTTKDDTYYGYDFSFWNPVTGLGNLWYDGFYRMCDTIKNNSVIQISNIGLNNQLSFINIMPQNTFNDFIFRSPVFGFSSIFSFFKIYSISGSGIISDNPTMILTGTSVCLLDVTQRYALSYALDETSHLYIIIQDVNFQSTAQWWRLYDADNSSIIRPIFAFDHISIVPYEFPNNHMSSLWNANGSERPSCPSIRTSSVGATETFTFNTDPTIDNALLSLITILSNDTFDYSYYVNFTYTRADGEQLFLSNPNFLSIDPPLDDPNALYIARNEAHSNPLSPHWGFFDKYPQWVLVPVNFPYSTEMNVNSDYLIFNTVNLCYLYIDSQNQSCFMRQVTADMTDEVSFLQFIFTIDNIEAIGPLFSPKNPRRPGLPPGIEFNITQTRAAVYNKQMIEFPFNGNYKYFTWDNPYADGQPLTLIVVDAPPEQLYEKFVLYWVFKRYIVDYSRVTRLLAFNDIVDGQENTGMAISANGDLNNVDNHAPSMTRNINFQSVLWECRCDTNVQDMYSTVPPPLNSYIYFDENLKETSPTNLRFISALSNPTVRAIGVNGPDPQPNMLPSDFPPAPSSVYWSATSMNKFAGNGGKIERSNYFYVGSIYSFFSFRDVPNGGFLSSRRIGGSPGWAPSTYNPRPVSDTLIGNANTMFTII